MDFTQIAPYLTDPLILIGFFLFLSFTFVRYLLKKGIIPRLPKTLAYKILKTILLYGFIIGLVIIFLGFLQKFRSSPDYQLNVIKDSIGITLSNQELSAKKLDRVEQKIDDISSKLKKIPNEYSPEINIPEDVIEHVDEAKTTLKNQEHYIELIQAKQKYHNQESEKGKRVLHKVIEAYNKIGIALAYKKKYDDAESYFNKAISIDSEVFMTLYNRGTVQIYLNKYEQALKDLNKAKLLNSNIGRIDSNIGAVNIYLNKYNKAYVNFILAIKKNPSDWKSYSNLGLVCAKLQKYDEVLYYSQKAIDLNPMDSNAFVNSALAFSEIGNQEKAIEYTTKALSINPDHPRAYIERGIAYARQKIYQKAIEDLNSAIDVDPLMGAAYQNLGTVYNLRGNKTKAQWYFDKAKEVGLNDIIISK